MKTDAWFDEQRAKVAELHGKAGELMTEASALERSIEAERAAMSDRVPPLPKTCPRCDGKGGSMDTTYDRTGQWAPCPWCDGNGEIYDHRAVKRFIAAIGAAK